MRTTSLEEKRAQGRPGAGRTRSLVCSVGSTRIIHHRLDRNIRPSLRDGVNAYFRALPGVRDLIVTVACGLVTRRLSARPRAPGPHDFVVRVHAARRATQPASIASRPTFVTTRSPLLPRRNGVTIIIKLRKTKVKYFLRKGWTCWANQCLAATTATHWINTALQRSRSGPRTGRLWRTADIKWQAKFSDSVESNPARKSSLTCGRRCCAAVRQVLSFIR